MARETTKFKTPVDKHEVEIYTYLTGGESEQIQDVMFDSVNMEIGTEVGGNIKGSVMRKSSDKTLEIMLVSIDGETDDLLKKIKDFRKEDYKFAVEKINEITKEEVSDTKKNKGSK